MARTLFGEPRRLQFHPRDPWLPTALLNRRWLDILRATEALRTPLWRLTPILDRRLRVQLPVALERLGLANFHVGGNHGA